MAFMVSLLVAAVFLLAVSHSSATRIDSQSFLPPYEQVDAKGSRILSDIWQTSGDANVNNNFVRLTPDRQSKRGAIWNRRALGVEEFSAILRMRISGQGEKFFGDGVALWITDSPHHYDGPLHGSIEQFRGVGIILDTFKNTENLAAHRDVLVLVNTGDKTLDDMTMNTSAILGCNANMRYHNKRNDFSVTDSSRIKITSNGVSFKVQVDEKNTGAWVDCVEVADLGFGKDFLRNAHVGMTASTGQLADNHDIISFEAYSDAAVMERDDVERLSKTDLNVINERASVDENIKLLNAAARDMLDRIEKLEHVNEHQHLAVTDDIASLMKKLEAKSDTNTNKITDLETKVREIVEEHLSGSIRDHVDEHFSGHLSRVGGQMGEMSERLNNDIDRKIHNVGVKLAKYDVDIETQKAAAEAGGNDSNWRWPFVILFLMCLGSLGSLYAFYRKLQKMHFL